MGVCVCLFVFFGSRLANKQQLKLPTLQPSWQKQMKKKEHLLVNCPVSFVPSPSPNKNNNQKKENLGHKNGRDFFVSHYNERKKNQPKKKKRGKKKLQKKKDLLRILFFFTITENAQ